MPTAVSRDSRPRQRVPPRSPRRKPLWLHQTRGQSTFKEISTRRERVILPFLVVLFLAFTVRGVAAMRLIPHVDEAATMLATEMVATKGVPVFPSGVLYLQGASLTYLLTPLAALIGGTIDQLAVLRFVNVLIGTGVVMLTALLAARIARHWVPGIIAGLIVAFDPASIAWSVYLRPYAALSLVSIGLVYAVVALVMDDAGHHRPWWRDQMLWIAALFAIGTFTHVGVWLLYPAVCLVALMTWGFGLLGPQRRVTIWLGVVAVTPLLFLALNSAVGPGSSTSSGEGGPSFVGSHLLTAQQFVSPTVNLQIWNALYHGSGLGSVMPVVLAASSGVLLGWLARHGRDKEQAQRRAFGAVLMLYWLPVAIAIAFIGTGGQYRYIIHVVPMGAIIIALAAYTLFGEIDVRRPRPSMAIPALGIASLLLPVLFFGVIATSWRLNDRGNDPDYFAAMDYVADRHAPGQPIIVALPPIAHVSLDEGARDDLQFLAGPIDNARVARYTLPVADGRLVDYWLGGDAIGSTDGLCRVLTGTAETSWVVADQSRLRWAYGGNMAAVINGATQLVALGANGVEVRASVPMDQWAPLAVQACIADGMTPKSPIEDNGSI